MFYNINQNKNTIEEITFDNVNENQLIAGIISIEQLKKHNNIFNFSEFAILELEKGQEKFRSSIDVYSNYIFGIINIVNTESINSSRDRIGFFIKKQLFLLVTVIDVNKSSEHLFKFGIERFEPKTLSLERLIYSVFESLLYKDTEVLEKLEFQINNLEEELSSFSTNKAFIPKMLIMKKEMLLLHNYYEQLIDIGEELSENKNGIFNDKNIIYFQLFSRKVSRMSKIVYRLRENLVQIREAFQSNMDYHNNSIMKVFTVVTTIFTPLSLIVGWYGMSFYTMPETSWQNGYLIVLVLFVIVIIFSLIIFKNKNLL